MASLQGTKIKDTFKSLLKVADNGEIEVTGQEITDGLGAGTGVSLNTQGDVIATGTVSFASLKDTGENITIAKFVDEADGIAANDNDTSIPTSAAVKQFVDTSASGLQSQITTNDNDITALQAADTTLQNNINTEESARIAGDTALQTQITNNDTDITALQAADTTLQNNINAEEAARIAADTTLQTNITAEASTRANADTSLQGQITSNDGDITGLDTRLTTAEGDITSIETKTDFITVTQSVNLDTIESDVAINNAKISFDSTSSNKLAGIESGAEVNTVDSVNGETGVVVLSTSDLDDVSATAPTDNQVLIFDVALGVYVPETLSSSAPVDSVNGQTGIVVLDADDIDDTSTTHKFTSQTDIDKLIGIEAGAEVNVVDSVNTKTGVVVIDPDDLNDTTTVNKFTTQAEINKLAGIEAGAEVNIVDSVNSQTGVVVLDADDINDSATTNKFVSSTEITKLGHITVTQAVDLDTMESDIVDLQTDKYDKTGGTITGSVTVTENITVPNLRGYNSLFGTASSAIITFNVTVVTKTSNHRYFNIGSSLGYHINGIESPFLTLLPGKTYRFAQDDGSNSSHQLLFYLDAAKVTLFSTGVTTVGTAGSAGSYTQIVVSDTTPTILHYQCVNHAYMGNSAQFNSNISAGEDLDIAGTTGTGSVDLDSQTLTIAGTANEIETVASGQTITIGLPSTITANVTGNVSGNLTGTVLTAAQANITSVGTLSSLAVSGSFAVDTNTLFVDTVGDRVLMGATVALQGDSLEVHAKGDGGCISVFGRPSGNKSLISFRANGSATQKAAIESGDIGLAFLTDVSERMRIDSSGVVSIGPTSNQIKLQSTGTFVSSTLNAHIINSDGTGAYSSGNLLIQPRCSSVSATSIVFATSNNTDTPTERMRILSSGGITFNGDTAAANALDDYEEGTWTPVITGSGSNPTFTGTLQGFYTKIGRMVSYTVNIVLATFSGGSGAARFSLPFTVGSFGFPIGATQLRNVDISNTAFQVNFEASAGQSFGVFIEQEDNAGSSQTQVGDIGGTAIIRFSGNYFV